MSRLSLHSAASRVKINAAYNPGNRVIVYYIISLKCNGRQPCTLSALTPSRLADFYGKISLQTVNEIFCFQLKCSLTQLHLLQL